MRPRFASLLLVVGLLVLAAACRKSDQGQAPAPAGATGTSAAAAAPGVPAGASSASAAEQAKSSSTSASPPAPGGSAAEPAAGAVPAERAESAAAGQPSSGEPSVAPSVPPAADEPPAGPRPSAHPALPAGGAAPEPTEVPPLSPALEAHLGRIAVQPGAQAVVQADVSAMLTAQQIRNFGNQLLQAAGKVVPAGDLPADAGCVVDLASSVTALTFVFGEARHEETALLLVDSTAGLPAIIACLRRIVAGELPDAAEAEAASGRVVLDPEVVLATVVPGTLALGTPEMVDAARAGHVARSLADSPELARSRAHAGAGPAYLAFFVVGSPEDDDMPLRGGLALRVVPQLAASGSFVFGRAKKAANALRDIAEGLDELAGRHGDDVERLAALLPPATARDLRAMLAAVVDARLVLEGSTFSFDVRFPASVGVDIALGTAAVAAPLLLFGVRREDEMQARAEAEEAAAMATPIPAPVPPASQR